MPSVRRHTIASTNDDWIPWSKLCYLNPNITFFMHLKIFSSKWWPFCSGHNVLNFIYIVIQENALLVVVCKVAAILFQGQIGKQIINCVGRAWIHRQVCNSLFDQVNLPHACKPRVSHHQVIPAMTLHVITPWLAHGSFNPQHPFSWISFSYWYLRLSWVVVDTLPSTSRPVQPSAQMPRIVRWNKPTRRFGTLPNVANSSAPCTI